MVKSRSRNIRALEHATVTAVNQPPIVLPLEPQLEHSSEVSAKDAGLRAQSLSECTTGDRDSIRGTLLRLSSLHLHCSDSHLPHSLCLSPQYAMLLHR